MHTSSKKPFEFGLNVPYLSYSNDKQREIAEKLSIDRSDDVMNALECRDTQNQKTHNSVALFKNEGSVVQPKKKTQKQKIITNVCK